MSEMLLQRGIHILKELTMLVLSHEYPPLGGGAGQNLKRLCEELGKKGIAVNLWTPASAASLQPSPGIMHHKLPSIRSWRFETNILSMLFFIAAALWRGFTRKSKRPDMIFSNMAIPAGIAGSVLSSYYGSPNVIWHHGSDVHGGQPHGPGFIQRMILRQIWKQSTLCLFISESLLNRANAFGTFGRFGVLPVAVSLPDRKNLSSSGKERIFLFAARMEPVKNPLLFVEAVKLFRSHAKFPEFRFCMVGGGRLFQAVLDAVARYSLESILTVEQGVFQDALFKLFEKCYAYIMTSAVEGFPTSIIEAGLFEVPSLGPRVVGIKDCIQDKITGLLFDQGDASSLCLAMENLASNPALQKNLGIQARTNAQLYSAQKTAETALEFFNQVTNH